MPGHPTCSPQGILPAPSRVVFRADDLYRKGGPFNLSTLCMHLSFFSTITKAGFPYNKATFCRFLISYPHPFYFHAINDYHELPRPPLLNVS